jgi:nicotinamidase-related amidase
MPLTTLDSTAALIVIDLQKGIVGLPTAHPSSDVVSRSAQLARAFRQRGLPVFLVNVTAPAPGRTDAGPRNFSFPRDWAELVAELEQQPEDHLISKQCVGAFIGTALNELLRERGVTQVFLAGIATSAGVAATARSAHDHGYHVVFAVDAMTDRDADTHRFCIEKIFPRIGETDTTENALKRLQNAPSQ